MSKNINRLPPQAIEAEQILLGTILMIPSCMGEISLLINEKHFYDIRHQKLFECFKSLYFASKPIDLVTVTNELKKTKIIDEIGGPMYLSDITRRVVSSTNVEYHARIVTEKYLLRQMIIDANDIINLAFDDNDPFVVSDKIEKNISAIHQCLIGKDYEGDHIQQATDVLAMIREKKENGLIGISTGNTALDSFIGGWASPDLIILSGRPGTGKTARMIEFMKRALRDGKHCILFSLEMSKEQIYKRLYSSIARIHSDKFRNNQLSTFDDAKLNEALQEMKEYNLLINDKSAITMNYIRAICRERKKKHGLDMVFIDYLQLISNTDNAKYKTQEQTIAEISMGLKSLAKDLQIPVMALSQLSRESEKRGDKRPMKSDLRHSGQIEQDADIIFGIFRPSQYGDVDSYKQENYDRQLFPRLSELLILKNRHGESDTMITEYFYGEYSRFEQQPLNETIGYTF